MIIIAEMYISLLPAVFAGILNMVWCKLPFLKSLQKPLDNNIILKDGKRIFGDNKTWKGFIGYILLGAVCTVIWGIICGYNSFLSEHNYMYRSFDNTFFYNLFMGLLFGFGYAVFELPNSFLKRRLDIQEGKSVTGFKKVFFIFLDQADSVFGCVTVLLLVYPMSFWFYLFYVLLGAATHLIINILLYFAHLRKNMF